MKLPNTPPLILLLLVSFWSCEELRLPESKEIQTKDIFDFTIDSEKNAPADGLAYYTLTATFTPAVKPEKRKVRFQSTLGSFTDGKSFVEIVADADGKASAFLKSDSVGIAVVKATVNNEYSIDKSVSFLPPDAEFTVIAEPSSSPVEADGIGNFRIIVTFSEDVTHGNRKATLKTSLGRFPNDNVTITLTADDTGVATTFLKSTDIGTAIVSVQSLTKRTVSEEHLTFSTPTPGFTLSTSTADDGVPADKITTHKIEVTFTKFNNIAERKVLLETSLGTFHNNDAKIELVADSENRAVAYLKSDQIGVAVVKGTFDNRYTQSITAPFIMPDPAFEFTSLPTTSVPADNYSAHSVEVLFKTFQTLASRRVFLRTSMGTFANDRDTITLLSGNDNIGKTFLKSPNEGTATVTAKFQENLVQEQLYSFSKSFPDQIIITSPSFSLKSGFENQILFETRLIKINGQPSPGFMIDYTAVDTLNNPVGAFLNNLPANDGKATVSYSAGPAQTPSGTATYRGRVQIRALLSLPDGDLTDDIQIYVTD